MDTVGRGGRMDQSQMRAANMSLILRHLRSHGHHSRARLAAETGLAKATMSNLIGELAARGLVREGDADRQGTVGRPGTLVSLDGGAVCGVGAEIAVDYLAVTAADLTGAVIREEVVPLAVAERPVVDVLDRVAAMLGRCVASLRADGLRVVGLTVAPPGIIDYAEGSVRFAPNIGWRCVPIVAELGARLGADAPRIHLENDAKLAALAEFASYEANGVRDLLFVTGDVGVGVGIVAEGRLIRGWSGFSGEAGHLPLDPGDGPCDCGRTGCWETIVGLSALLRLAAPDEDELNDPARPLEERLGVIRGRADAGDARTLAALRTITANLARGLSILVDVLNPRVIVLGGYFASLAGHIVAPVAEELARRRMDEGSAVEVAPTRLGMLSASYGGALAALEDVFADPTIVPSAER